MLARLRTFLRGRKFTALVLALLAMILVPAVHGDPEGGASGLLWGLVLVAAVHAAAGNRRFTLAFAAVALVGFGGRLATLFVPEFPNQGPIDAGSYIVAAIFLGMTIYVLFSALLKAPHISGDTVMGAICVYLLLGFLWTNFYALIYIADGGSFSFPAHIQIGAQDSIVPEFTFGYYSFVTLTTLGYGDVIPISYQARTFSWLEAVVGVTYMATVIAFLVSQMIVDRQEGRRI